MSQNSKLSKTENNHHKVSKMKQFYQTFRRIENKFSVYVFLSVVIVMVFFLFLIKANAATQLVADKGWVSYLNQSKSLTPKTQNIITGSFSYNFVDVGLVGQSTQNNKAKFNDQSLGRYGFGIGFERNYFITNKQTLGVGVGFNGVDRSSFASSNDRLMTTSLYDFSVNANYQYLVVNQLALGVSGGLAFVYGFVEQNPDIGFYSRIEPIIGLSARYQVNNHFNIKLSYQHYFGVASDRAYQSRQAAPSIDRISIGVGYAL